MCQTSRVTDRGHTTHHCMKKMNSNHYCHTGHETPDSCRLPSSCQMPGTSRQHWVSSNCWVCWTQAEHQSCLEMNWNQEMKNCRRPWQNQRPKPATNGLLTTMSTGTKVGCIESSDCYLHYGFY